MKIAAAAIGGVLCGATILAAGLWWYFKDVFK